MKLISLSKTLLLLTITFSQLLVFPASAAMISTNQAVANLNMAAERQKIANFLSRDEVKDALVKNGVTSQDASMRVASLSDAEVQRLSKQIDQATAGGDVGLGGVLIAVLVVVLIIFLVRRL